jgi:hypothetical protein
MPEQTALAAAPPPHGWAPAGWPPSALPDRIPGQAVLRFVEWFDGG